MGLNLNILKQTPRIDGNKPFIVYRDLHLDVQPKYTNNNELLIDNKSLEVTDIVSDINENAIKNSLYNIFSTMPGQKILSPEFGLNFTQYLFSNLSDNNALLIKQKIIKHVGMYEPRVKIQYVSVVPVYEQNQYNISIAYNNKQNFNFLVTESGITIQ